MAVVRMPNGDLVNFPDDMPKEKISAFIATRFPDDVKAHLDDMAKAEKSGMSWSTLNKMFMQGVPEEQRATEPTANTLATAASNIPSSVGEFVKNTAQAVMHPIDTAENLGAIGKGVLQKLGLWQGNDSVQYADAVGKFFVDRYGSKDAIRKTLEEDPVGMAADVSLILTGGGSVAARAPGMAGKVGEVVSQVGRTVDPLNAVAAAAKGGGSAAAKVLGVTTGVDQEAIKIAARSGAEVGEAAKAFREGFMGQTDHAAVVAEAKAAVGKMREERGQVYRDKMADVGADTTILDFSKIDAAVNKVQNVKTYKGQDLSPKTKAIRDEMAKEIADWKNLPAGDFHTVEGLDALKQKLGDIRDAAAHGTPEQAVANQIYQAVRQTIVDQAPEYAKVMKGYEQASDLIREMEKTLSLNPKASVDTSLRKLESALRNNVSTNYGRRAELVDFLSRAGAPHLMEKLAGQMLSSATPRGLGKAVASGEGISALAALAAGNPAVAAALAGGVAASSPALVGGAAHLAGAATRLPLRQLGRSAFQLGRLSNQ